MRIESKLGEVALLTDTSSSYSRETKSGSNVVWQSSRDKGESHQAIEHTEITAQGPVRIIAAKGVTVEYRDTGNVDDSITQLSKQPGLEWMAQLRADPKVDWRAVAEAHQSWDYKAEGLTGAGAALLTLAVAAATYGYGAKIAALFEGMAGQAALAAGAKAGFMALCGQASVALVNNKGDLLAALRDLGREASLKALASSILAAGLTAGALDLAELNEAQNLTTAEYLQNVAKETAIQGVVHAGVDTALYGGNPGQNLLDGLRGAAASTLGADVAAKIGAAYKNGDLNYVTHKIAHAALGGAMGLATTGDAGAGAIGGAVGEMTAEAFVKGFTNKQLENPENKKTLSEAELKELDADLKRMREFGVDLSKLSAGIAAALAGADVNTAAQAGGNAAENNCFFVIPIVLELVDKGLQLYDAYQLAKALEEGNTEEALKLSGIIAAGLATDAMPGNVVAIKLGLALKKFGLTKLGNKIIAKFGVSTIESAGRINRAHLGELTQKGVKYTPEDIVFTHKMPSGDIIFLEKGSATSGLEHIFSRHASDFSNKGIKPDEIESFIYKTIQNNKPYISTTSGEMVFRVQQNGKHFDLKIITGNNGYIVSAYPWSK